MSAIAFIRFLVFHKIDFSCNWDSIGANYQIHIILGNKEHIIDFNDYDKIDEVKNEIKTYWRNNI